MEKFVERTLLYDFYGELLTKRQQQIYESVVLEDYSLSEVAEELNISRQGVHDMIRRCDKALEGYEEKLHLVEKFVSIKEKIHRIPAKTGNGSLSGKRKACGEEGCDFDGAKVKHDGKNCIRKE